MTDAETFQAADTAETQYIGFSVAKCLMNAPLTLFVTGELGAGKTTFAQGLAKGLGIDEAVTSPTYALEQRYGDRLSHIDLYRLKPAEAGRFIAELDDFPGIRLIEWPDRGGVLDAGMTVAISEQAEGRTVSISASDIPVPPDEEIRAWYKETQLQEHIIRHMECVAEACTRTADALIRQKRFVRRNALRAAALTHDLLRFTDFTSMQGDYAATPAQMKTWQELKTRYGTPHEAAAERFLADKGYAALGAIVRTHRGSDGPHAPITTEQMALAYADKRSLLDSIVSVDERFDDFIRRYGDGKTEQPESKAWRDTTKRIERWLFADGASF